MYLGFFRLELGVTCEEKGWVQARTVEEFGDAGFVMQPNRSIEITPHSSLQVERLIKPFELVFFFFSQLGPTTRSCRAFLTVGIISNRRLV
jgi:hypothetical protein